MYSPSRHRRRRGWRRWGTCPATATHTAHLALRSPKASRRRGWRRGRCPTRRRRRRRGATAAHRRSRWRWQRGRCGGIAAAHRRHGRRRRWWRPRRRRRGGEHRPVRRLAVRVCVVPSVRLACVLLVGGLDPGAGAARARLRRRPGPRGPPRPMGVLCGPGPKGKDPCRRDALLRDVPHGCLEPLPSLRERL